MKAKDFNRIIATLNIRKGSKIKLWFPNRGALTLTYESHDDRFLEATGLDRSLHLVRITTIDQMEKNPA